MFSTVLIIPWMFFAWFSLFILFPVVMHQRFFITYLQHQHKTYTQALHNQASRTLRLVSCALQPQTSRRLCDYLVASFEMSLSLSLYSCGVHLWAHFHTHFCYTVSVLSQDAFWQLWSHYSLTPRQQELCDKRSDLGSFWREHQGMPLLSYI